MAENSNLDPGRMLEVFRNSPTLQEVRDRVADHLVAFIRIEDDDAFLIGSGTLASVGDIKGVLTAAHVLESLPRNGLVGLAFPTRYGALLGAISIKLDFTVPIYFKRKKDQFGGPDLGFLRLLKPIQSIVPSTKTFYNLSSQNRRILKKSKKSGHETWLIAGSAAEWSKDGLPEYGFEMVKEFTGAIGAGLVVERNICKEFDYLEFSTIDDENYEGPKSFEGYSGGSLWSLYYTTKKSVITVNSYILSGVIFSQSNKVEGERLIRCHGEDSIYKELVDKANPAY